MGGGDGACEPTRLVADALQPPYDRFPAGPQQARDLLLGHIVDEVIDEDLPGRRVEAAGQAGQQLPIEDDFIDVVRNFRLRDGSARRRLARG